MAEKQKTIREEVSLSGIALHTGVRAHLTIRPAPEDTGMIFRRTDVAGAPSVKAFAGNVVDVRRGTTISFGEAKVYTVEHVLAAFHAAGIDNAYIEMDGPEPPIADGSGLPYAEMVRNAGVCEQSKDTEVWSVDSPVIVEEGDTKTIMLPYDRLKITCIVYYGATPLDCQYFSDVITSTLYYEQVAPARTFCLYRELEQLIAMGLVRGGSLDNAAIIHNGAIICKDEPRFSNELVRHKVLDIIGDLYLTGKRMNGHVIAVKPGHPTNVVLAKKIVEQKMK